MLQYIDKISNHLSVMMKYLINFKNEQNQDGISEAIQLIYECHSEDLARDMHNLLRIDTQSSNKMFLSFVVTITWRII